MGTLSKSWSELSLVEKLNRMRATPCLILDTSGSMNEDCEPGCRKIDALRKIVSKQKAKMFSFNYDLTEVKADSIPEPSGGTFLAPALREMKKLKIKEAVIITDGEVSDQQDTLAEVKGLKLKVLYVGAGPKPPFLDELARNSGGFCDQEDLKFTKELEEKITLLLGPAPEDEKGSIQL